MSYFPYGGKKIIPVPCKRILVSFSLNLEIFEPFKKSDDNFIAKKTLQHLNFIQSIGKNICNFLEFCMNFCLR
jgi:hypothetical protein